MKSIMIPSILWQYDRILCLKSTWTMWCKICMMEGTTNLSQMETCQARSYQRQLVWRLTCSAPANVEVNFTIVVAMLRHWGRIKRKKAKSSMRTKHEKSKRFSFKNIKRHEHPTNLNPNLSTMPTSFSSNEESASPQYVTLVFHLTTLTLYTLILIMSPYTRISGHQKYSHFVGFSQFQWLARIPANRLATSLQSQRLNLKVSLFVNIPDMIEH